MSRKKLGQHFLRNAGWRARILDALAPRPDDTWIDVGAGHGEMTRELAGRARRVVAIELDAKLLGDLRSLAEETGNVEVIPGDVLRMDFARLARGEQPRVYGSLPYYITSPILQRLFEFAGYLREINVVIQVEVALRLVAHPGSRDFGYLSVLTQYFAKPELVLRVPPGAFAPPPKVASALVRLRLPGERASLGIQAEKEFLQFAGECFAQKRKTLANNLRRKFPGTHVEQVIAQAGLKPKVRAEELTLAQLAAVFRETGCSSRPFRRASDGKT